MMIMLACISLGGTHAPPWDAHEFGEMEFWASFLSLKQRVASRVLHFSLVPNKKERLVTKVPWQVGFPSVCHDGLSSPRLEFLVYIS